MTKKNREQIHSRSSKHEDYPYWYKNPTILISLFSLLVSIITGTVTIFNTNYIARLDKDVYVPNLQYHIYSYPDGRISFEITNQGYVSAHNVTATINWDSVIKLTDCSVLPPYQDTSPIQPVTSDNITYRLSSLPIQSVFKIMCKVFFSENDEFVLQPTATVEPNPTPIFATPAPMSTAKIRLGLDLQGGIQYLSEAGTPIHLPDGTMVIARQAWQADESQKFFEVSIVADNSRPAIEIGEISAIWILEIVHPQ